MDIPGTAALWTVGSFLLGQGVVFGGVLINNASQTRREQAAREDERQRTHAERREVFELAHLQDLHAELSELLLVAETCILQWCTWHRMLDTPDRRANQEARERRDQLEASATEQERIMKLHLQKINRHTGLVIPNRLRARVENACGQYERLTHALADDGPDDTQAALPGVIAQLHRVQSEVAERIRDIYVSADNLSVGEPGPAARRR
ncbi:hypothetical protein ABZ604_31315 [Streptomyces sp. NPDC012473]|uniref:hypothetical protein n=1 Tax=Streptomyces sp. NPDC012473 TaxID=3156676 RepID=UPI0033C2B3A8